MFDTPIVLIIFNRPVHTKKVLEKIVAVNPERLYVIADGSRSTNKNDIELVKKTREIVEKATEKMDSKVIKIYSDDNLGLESRIVSGLNEVFRYENKAIILEDDCIPISSFFRFCYELLDKYEHEKKIVHISGSRYVRSDPLEKESYYFSRYSIEWGWATWKDRWERYDGSMSDWPAVKNNSSFGKLFLSNKLKNYWFWIFDNCYNGKINSWAYKWLYKNLSEGKYSIIPKYNLIKNIGLGNNSTNTVLKNKYLQQQTNDLSFPLIHPTDLIIRLDLDKIQERKLYCKSTLWLEIVTKRIKPLYKLIMKNINIRKYFN